MSPVGLKIASQNEREMNLTPTLPIIHKQFENLFMVCIYTVQNCLRDISTWMQVNFLNLNKN